MEDMEVTRRTRIATICIAAGRALAMVHPAAAQDPVRATRDPDPGAGPADPLSALVTEALERNPRIAAARAQAESLEERISPAGTWEDPVLTLGFVNLRTTSFDFGDDFMTMKMVELGQRIPLPGQLGHRRAAARSLAESGGHVVEQTRVDVIAEVKQAYGEIYYLDRALRITDRNLSLLSGLARVTFARYATGVGRQPGVLRAGLEIDALEGHRIALSERRRGALARLNAVLDRPSETPVDSTPFPGALLAVAEGASSATERATSPARRASAAADRAASPPVGTATSSRPSAFISALEPETSRAIPELPPLDTLIERAVEGKPALEAHVARIRAAEEEVLRARADRWPAPRLTLGFAQRDGFDDMMNATVSFSLPIFLGAKQNAAVREEEAALARERALHDAMVNEIRHEVTDAYARVLDAYGQLGLFRTGILARAEANLDAALVAYRSGAEDFLALLDGQAGLYRYQLDYHRRLADLLSTWAELERAVGEEIQP